MAVFGIALAGMVALAVLIAAVTLVPDFFALYENSLHVISNRHRCGTTLVLAAANLLSSEISKVTGLLQCLKRSTLPVAGKVGRMR
jgi:hypothetical protein